MNEDTLCAYPFKSLALKHYNRDGTLAAFWPCCMMGDPVDGVSNNNRLGIDGVDKMTPGEMFSHPRMELLRENLKSGVRDSACDVCWKKEDRGMKSFRQTSFESSEDKKKIIEDCSLREVDISITNLCNLRCRMCTPGLSNALMQDNKFFKENNLLEQVTEVTGWWNDAVYSYKIEESDSWKWLMENTAQLTTLKMSGGEPFYNQNVIRLLDKCIADGTAKNIILNFRTNATLFTAELLTKLAKFKHNWHDLSVDGHGTAYDYIRYPSLFTELDSNIRRYSSYFNDNLKLVYIVSIHNVMNIPDFIDWARSINPGVMLMFTEIYDGDRGIALKHLSKDILIKAKMQLQQYTSNDPGLNIQNAINQITFAIENNAENKEKALLETELFDKSRNQKFEDFLHPDITEWLKK
jgi:molybdenum cofactor biosynthesis enzyme MoaA